MKTTRFAYVMDAMYEFFYTHIYAGIFVNFFSTK